VSQTIPDPLPGPGNPDVNPVPGDEPLQVPEEPRIPDAPDDPTDPPVEDGPVNSA
jgi:hypothetical protein